MRVRVRVRVRIMVGVGVRLGLGLGLGATLAPLVTGARVNASSILPVLAFCSFPSDSNAKTMAAEAGVQLLQRLNGLCTRDMVRARG